MLLKYFSAFPAVFSGQERLLDQVFCDVNSEMEFIFGMIFFMQRCSVGITSGLQVLSLNLYCYNLGRMLGQNYIVTLVSSVYCNAKGRNGIMSFHLPVSYL